MNKIYRAGSEVVIIDPTPDLIPLIKKMNPNFEIESKPPKNYEPLFLKARESGSLDEKLRMSMAFMYHCEICGLRCGANRFKRAGKCSASNKPAYYPPFIHICEESVINPALILNFTECPMNCAYCIAKAKNKQKPLSFDADEFWKQAEVLLKNQIKPKVLEFGGGEPSLYIPWIILLLKHAPYDFGLPIVLNHSLYISPEAFEALNGLIDVYLADFRYGSNACAERLSKVNSYLECAVKGIEALSRSKGKIIVRILVLPNHFICCHRRSLEILAEFKDRVWLSVLDQYVPEYQASYHRDIARRPTPSETARVKELAAKLGLRDVNENAENFWIAE